MATNSLSTSTRRVTWDWARDMVDPLIFMHELEDQNLGGGVFQQSTVQVSKVEQHIDHVIRVAEWLLEPLDLAQEITITNDKD